MHLVVASPGARGLRLLCAALGLSVAAANAEGNIPPPRPEALDLSQLRDRAEQEPSALHSFRIVAEVRAADHARGALALQDATGVEFVQLDLMDLKNRRIEAGAMVSLEGSGCVIRPRRFGLAIVPGMVVDNDGIHSYTAESGTVFLRAGIRPIRLQWFNGAGDAALSVEYEGPGLPRQPIPDSAFFRAGPEAATGRAAFSAGLDFRCYEGVWERLPDFASLAPVRTGVAANFDLAVRTRPDAVGLEFAGFISIPRDGAYTFHVASDDGSRLFVGEPVLDVRVLGGAAAPGATNGEAPPPGMRHGRWTTLEGAAGFVGVWDKGGELQMSVGDDDIRVEVFESGDFAPGFPLHAMVRASGAYRNVSAAEGSRAAGVLQVLNWAAIRPVPEPDVGALLPPDATPAAAATPIAKIKALSAEMAGRQLPVSIRGVVTATLPAFRGVVVQDATRGIYVSLENVRETEPLRRGEYHQIDGVTGPGLFAPVVVAQRVLRLGLGRLPQPVRATRDQLMSGSLDTQYVEMEGVVVAVEHSRLDLLTEEGRLPLSMGDIRPDVLAGYLNALARIRGVAFGPFDMETRRLTPGPLAVGSPVVQVIQPPPRDLFDAPARNIAEFLFYDPQAAPLRLLKVSGQIIYARPGEFFLTDGAHGMRVTTRSPVLFAAGDQADAAGFAELAGPVPELKEAVARVTGRAPLPEPARLSPDRLLQADHAGTLVQVNATLVNQWRDGGDHVLDLQSGYVGFRARINTRGRQSPSPPLGSRVELTGVYAPQGGRAGDRTVNAFELLLHSPAGLRVLAAPPWWTLKRVLVIAGVLAALLCGVLVWNKQLHGQVQERGRMLEMEIRNRERAEQQRAAEAERARIARDLHDELGTGLTEVSLLASAGLGEQHAGNKSAGRFSAIAEKARALVSGLDVIVWAVDPKRNSLQSFADYTGGYARELLSASGLACRLKIPVECEAVALPGAARHSLFLAVKEALNNVIRHAAATEVELHLNQTGHSLEIVIADNGRGFDWSAVRHGNGLANLQERLKSLRGRCRVESRPGAGTTVKLSVPLPQNQDQDRPGHPLA